MKTVTISLVLCFFTYFSFAQSGYRIEVIATNYTKTGSNFQFDNPSLVQSEAIDNSTQNPVKILTLGKAAPNPNPWISFGWGLYGDCWEYGTFISGSNGVTIFIPCGINCTGFPSVCPEPGGGMCRFSFEVAQE